MVAKVADFGLSQQVCNRQFSNINLYSQYRYFHSHGKRFTTSWKPLQKRGTEKIMMRNQTPSPLQLFFGAYLDH